FSDWLVIVLYVAGIIGLGAWFGRDQHNTRDYFLGSRNLLWWCIGFSFGAAGRKTAGGMFLISETLAAGVRVYVASIPVKLMLGDRVLSLGAGDPILGAIVLFVALSLVYTYIGGVKAVIWTDAVQFGLFLLGGLFALFYIPTLVDGAWAKAAAAGKLHWLNLVPPAGIPWKTFLLGSPF